jgi:hypothetical protein
MGLRRAKLVLPPAPSSSNDLWQVSYRSILHNLWDESHPVTARHVPSASREIMRASCEGVAFDSCSLQLAAMMPAGIGVPLSTALAVIVEDKVAHSGHSPTRNFRDRTWLAAGGIVECVEPA